MIQRRVIVTGDVQGVGFRAATVRIAVAWPGLRGTVRNLPDGRVEAVFCGEEDAVLKVCAWCRNGPPSARVTHLEIKEEPPDPGLRDFHAES